MATLTARKAITYTEDDSGVSFAISVSKTKVGRHGYRQVMECGSGVQRRLFEVASNPNYSKLVFFHVENIGDYDLSVHVVTAGANAEAGVIVPPRPHVRAVQYEPLERQQHKPTHHDH